MEQPTSDSRILSLTQLDQAKASCTRQVEALNRMDCEQNQQQQQTNKQTMNCKGEKETKKFSSDCYSVPSSPPDSLRECHTRCSCNTTGYQGSTMPHTHTHTQTHTPQSNNHPPAHLPPPPPTHTHARTHTPVTALLVFPLSMLTAHARDCPQWRKVRVTWRRSL